MHPKDVDGMADGKDSEQLSIDLHLNALPLKICIIKAM